MANTSKRILVVDDVELERQAIVKRLMKRGYTNIEQAADGKDAIEKAAKNRPDLVFMDVVMPGTSGFQASRLITKADATIPVVFVTSKDRAPDKVLATESGAKDYIVKPIDDVGMDRVLTQFG